MNKLNTARAPNIKADSPEDKEVVDFAERLRYVLELKINKCRREIRDCTIPMEADRLLAQIMAFQWVQGRI